ncbi:hypothetical protein L7F22_058892 [Adiantum nelumboides]|nr:hypothetical protein [Adiantum nelumboides]
MPHPLATLPQEEHKEEEVRDHYAVDDETEDLALALDIESLAEPHPLIALLPILALDIQLTNKELQEVKPFGDRIVLRGLRFLGVHGVNEDEKKATQPFIIDMDAWLNMAKASETDNLNDTVSYTDLHRVIQEVVEGPHFDLLEALANTIATTIFCRFKVISDVRLRIGKPKVASKKDADYVGLEIFRSAPL